MSKRGIASGIGTWPGGSARLRRPYCDELGNGPFSCGRRSERPRPGFFCSRDEGLFEADAYRLVYRQEPHTKSNRLFPLEPRAKTLERGKEVKKDTLNKDIRNITAFLNWAVKNRYVASGLEVKKVKVTQKPVTALFPQQVRDLIKLVSAYPTLRLRVLLAVTTGFRRGDIEAIRIGDIHFDRNTITTRNRKANKAMAERPVPEQITTELSNYVATLPDGQESLFADRFSAKRWAKIRRKAGLPDPKFHDLRKTFASLLAQRGVSTALTQRLLEHSSPQLTNQVYTNVDPVLRQAINLLPVAEWL